MSRLTDQQIIKKIVKLMGLTIAWDEEGRCIVGWPEEGFGIVAKHFDILYNAADAMELLDDLEKDGYWWTLQKLRRDQYYIHVFKGLKSAVAKGETKERAICLAYLKAKGVEV